MSKYILWRILNDRRQIECYISEEFAKDVDDAGRIVEDACSNALTYYAFGEHRQSGTVSFDEQESAYYVELKLTFPGWEKDREAKAAALKYIENNPVPEGGFQTFREERNYAKNLHDYIAKKAVYPKMIYTPEDLTGADAYENMQEAWNVLTEGNNEAVCAGYARAFALVCQYAGIDCSYISGSAEDFYHAWNIIYPMDGSAPVVVDVTWDDNLSNDAVGQKRVSKRFFYNGVNADNQHTADEKMLDFIMFLHEDR